MTELDGAPTSRAAPRALRFARRLRGQPDLTFAARVRELTAARDADEHGEHLSLTLALLAARPALDRELSGARLQALAAVVGEDLLDAVRDADLGTIAAPVFESVLPPPAALARHGEQLLAKVSASPDIAALADLAAALVRGTKAPV